jgi:hypothetical protein
MKHSEVEIARSRCGIMPRRKRRVNSYKGCVSFFRKLVLMINKKNKYYINIQFHYNE